MSYAQSPLLIDGLLVDPDTGEVVGVEKPQFHVTDAHTAEWLMERLFNIDLDISKEEKRLKALMDNAQSKINDLKRRRNGLMFKYGPELEHYALTQAENGKSKTWKCPFGTVSFRSVPSTYKLNDPAAGLAWAKENWPEAVKVEETFLPSLVSREVKEQLTFFERIEGRQAVAIKTILEAS